ncbi:hypothetical protein QQX09_09005 [Demequina sp. SYSU T00192]|uniref:Leucine rich repeat variant domain-containing protein n=1 Tax=Demequina litoralis TaxID=3051660 RepID=A0ABT8GAA4_9MICO|nr:hypothetical protein [Demequina sp. SYSU T00192]MDN4475992.1 hypothetical protein [Demequina sp. SYSU T00192]
MALTAGSRIIFLVGAVTFISFALLAEYALDLSVPAVVLALPLVPVAVIFVIVRRLLHASPHAAEAPAAAAATMTPGPAVPFGAAGAGAERLLAASPYATAAELSELAYARPELRPAIAANPSAPASLLQWLIEQGEPAVLAAISARGRLLG